MAAAIIIIIVVGGQSREEQRPRGRCSACGGGAGAERAEALLGGLQQLQIQRTLFTSHNLNLHLQGTVLLSPFPAQFLETVISHCISIPLFPPPSPFPLV